MLSMLWVLIISYSSFFWRFFSYLAQHTRYLVGRSNILNSEYVSVRITHAIQIASPFHLVSLICLFTPQGKACRVHIFW